MSAIRSVETDGWRNGALEFRASIGSSTAPARTTGKRPTRRAATTPMRSSREPGSSAGGAASRGTASTVARLPARGSWRGVPRGPADGTRRSQRLRNSAGGRIRPATGVTAVAAGASIHRLFPDTRACGEPAGENGIAGPWRGQYCNACDRCEGLGLRSRYSDWRPSDVTWRPPRLRSSSCCSSWIRCAPITSSASERTGTADSNDC